MHSYRPGAGQSVGRTRLLYLFRTPSNRKIGRNLLDPEVMEALEHTHPDLTFDWQGMLRTPVQAPDEKERGRDRHERGGERRDRRERSSGEAQARKEKDQKVAPEAPLAIVEDESLLGKAAGAVEAARLRAAYSELVQRIARRARTPEDRDRLIERATRLNPDDWHDAEAITAGMAAFAEEHDAIRQELPRRRRGRRGGRTKDRESTGSAIMENDADEPEVVAEAGADDRSFDDGVGAGQSGPADAAAGDAFHDGD